MKRTRARAMRSGFAVTCACVAVVCGPPPSRAELTRAELVSAGLRLRTGADLPADVSLRLDDGRAATLGSLVAGRPVLLTFVDYDCATLCGTVAGALAEALAGTDHLAPGRDYTALFVSLRPASWPQTRGAAAAFRSHELADSGLRQAALLATASAADLGRLESAVGLTAIYDAARDQFAHPVDVIVADAGGRLTTALDPLELTPAGLTAAIHGAPAASTLAARVGPICAGFAAALGVRTQAVLQALSLLGAASIPALVAGVLWLSRDRQRRKGREAPP